MAIIVCPECRKSVSDMAHQCPGCGYPLGAVTTPTPARPAGPITTIEQTSKKWKKLKLVSAGLIITGLISMGAGIPAISVLLMMAGAGIGIYSVFGAWWHHS